MKLGIVTFFNANNYGAVLQCYALASQLKIFGHEVYLADITLTEKMGGLRAKLRNLAVSKLAFFKFREQELPSLSNDIAKIDAFIFGSDQIWNIDITKNEFEKFMGSTLGDKQRIAYAASFGVSDWNFSEQTQRSKQLLSHFKTIGIREKSGVDILQEKFALESTQVIDPTLLIEPSYYYKLFKKRTLDQRMACYVFNKDKLQISNIKKVGSKLGLKPVILNDVRIRKGIDSIPYPNVSKWLSYIDASEFVITDSFHCMVFSILFKKNFIAIPAIEARAGRMTSLLAELGLSNRYYRNLDDALSSDQVFEKIDYSKVDLNLNKLRALSLQFLTDSLD
ncbi:polysaccharide pyruvyl transferase family protein [Vibrio sp. WJH972]